MVESDLKLISKWKTYVEKAVKAIREIVPNTQIYLIGGAAEKRLTAQSDIDLLLVLNTEPTHKEKISLREKIIKQLENKGIPPYFPLQIHITTKKETPKHKRKKIPLTSSS